MSVRASTCIKVVQEIFLEPLLFENQLSFCGNNENLLWTWDLKYQCMYGSKFVFFFFIYSVRFLTFRQSNNLSIRRTNFCVSELAQWLNAQVACNLLTKLSLEHVNLTSWSRMRVDLATQVCCCCPNALTCILSSFFLKGFQWDYCKCFRIL